jgi:hypothetical protein
MLGQKKDTEKLRQKFGPYGGSRKSKYNESDEA